MVNVNLFSQNTLTQAWSDRFVRSMFFMFTLRSGFSRMRGAWSWKLKLCSPSVARATATLRGMLAGAPQAGR